MAWPVRQTNRATDGSRAASVRPAGGRCSSGRQEEPSDDPAVVDAQCHSPEMPLRHRKGACSVPSPDRGQRHGEWISREADHGTVVVESEGDSDGGTGQARQRLQTVAGRPDEGAVVLEVVWTAVVAPAHHLPAVVQAVAIDDVGGGAPGRDA